MLELAAAVTAGVNVVLVRKEGARWPDDSGARAAEHPPAWLINRQEECVRRTLFSVKAVAHTDEYYRAFCDELMRRLVAPEVAAARKRAAAAARVQTRSLPPPAAGGEDDGTAGGSQQPTPLATPSAGHGRLVHSSSAPAGPTSTPPRQTPPPLLAHAASMFVPAASGASAPASLLHPAPLYSAEYGAAQLPAVLAELQQLRAALADVRRELADMRHTCGGSSESQQAPLMLALAMVGIVACCVTAIVALHAAQLRRA